MPELKSKLVSALVFIKIAAKKMLFSSFRKVTIRRLLTELGRLVSAAYRLRYVRKP